MTLFLLGICFGIILGVSLGQESYKESIEDKEKNLAFQTTAYIISALSSILILIVNTGLLLIIKKFGFFEKHITITKTNVSIAKKLSIA